MMTAAECCRLLASEEEPDGHDFLALGQFLDDMGRATVEERLAAVSEAPSGPPRWIAFVAAVVDQLGEELGYDTPAWAWRAASPDPFFVWPAGSPAGRFTVMLETPPAFAMRNVYVTANVLERRR